MADFDPNEPLASEAEALGRSYDAGTRNVKTGVRDKGVDVTPVCDSGAYATGDLLFNATELADVFAEVGGAGLLVSLAVLDKADQTGVDMDILFFDTAPADGTKGDAVAITDAEMAKCIGQFTILAAEWKDFGGSKRAEHSFAPKQMRARSDSTSLWVVGVARGTATYGVSGLVVSTEFMRN